MSISHPLGALRGAVLGKVQFFDYLHFGSAEGDVLFAEEEGLRYL